MLKISLVELLRSVVAWIKTADARRNMESYLKTQIAAGFIDKLNLKALFARLPDRVDLSEVDEDVFLEDVVDKFIDEDGGGKLQGLLMSELMKEEKLTKEDAVAVIRRGDMSEETRRRLPAIFTKYTKIIYKYISEFLYSRAQEKLREKRDEPSVTEEMEKSVGVPPESEMDELLEREHAWEEGLFKDVMKAIHQKVQEMKLPDPGKKRALYKYLLKYRYLCDTCPKKPEKTFDQISEMTGLAKSRIEVDDKILHSIVEQVLREHGKGPKFEEKVEVPAYTEYLKGKADLQKDLSQWLIEKGKTREKTERTKDILKLFAQGKTTQEVVDALKFPRTTVQDVKNTHFDKAYEEWYMDHVKDSREAFLLAVQAVVKRVKYKDPKDEGRATGVSRMHEVLLQNALDKELVRVTVSFESDFDTWETKPEGKDPHFKWTHYQATINEKRHGFKDYGVRYSFESDLEPGGAFKGTGHSSLEIYTSGKEGEDAKWYAVQSTDPLHEMIDKHLKTKVLSEGVIPHGHFPVEYVNTKTGKQYSGTRLFLKHHQDIVTHDEPHKRRLQEKERWENLKQFGRPKMDDYTELLEVRKHIHETESMMKKETDPEKKKQYKTHMEQLQEKLKELSTGRTKRIEDIKKLEEEEWKEPTKTADFPVYAAVLPDVQDPKSKELMALFKAYGVDERPNPKLWLEPSDIIVLAKTLSVMIARAIERKMKEKRPKGYDIKQWKEDLEREKEARKKDLDRAKMIFPDFIKELKVRRDQFEHNHLQDFKDLEHRKDVHWVDNPTRVDSLMGRVKKELETVPELTVEKQPTVRVLEKGKYKALEGFLVASQKGFTVFANRLDDASIRPSASPEASAKLTQAKDDIFDNYTKMMTEADRLTEKKKEDVSPEEVEQIKKFKTELKTLNHELRSMERHIHDADAIPALTTARVLIDFSAYFASLYSFFSSLLWFHEKYSEEDESPKDIVPEREEDVEAPKEKPEKKKEEPKEEKPKKELTKEELEAQMTGLRKDVVQKSKDVSNIDLKAKSNLKGAIQKLRSLLSKFTGGMVDLQTIWAQEKEKFKAPKTPAKAPETAPAKSASVRFSPESIFRVVTAMTEEQQKEYEEKFKKYVIPESLLHKANGMIVKLKDHKNEDVKKMGETAQAELDELTKNLVDAYKGDVSTREEIHSLSKKWNMSPANAAVRMRKSLDAMTAAAMDEFVDAWTDVLHKADSKDKVRPERSPLGNKPHHNYERMIQFVKKHIQFPEEKEKKEEPEEPAPGIPTPKKIREEIERMWSKEKEPSHTDLITQYKGEFQEAFGGSEKAKKRTRKKVIKPPPPIATWEQLKDEVAKMMKSGESARSIVLTVLADYAERVERALSNIKDGEELEFGPVVDGFVYMLKQFQNTIVNLQVHPSRKQWEMPRPNQPKFTGTPDIPIDSYAECMKIFNLIREIYGVVNHYIAPDSLGLPPLKYIPPAPYGESQANRENLKKYVPLGLLDWMQWYMEKEGKAPKAPPEKHERLKAPPDEPEKKPTLELKKYEPTVKATIDFKCQLSANVAKRAADIVLPENELDAILS